MTSIKDLCIQEGVRRQDDTPHVKLYWCITDDEPFYTARVGDPENLTVEEVEHIINAVNLFRTFK